MEFIDFQTLGMRGQIGTVILYYKYDKRRHYIYYLML